jgi:hypothetical protein
MTEKYGLENLVEKLKRNSELLEIKFCDDRELFELYQDFYVNDLSIDLMDNNIKDIRFYLRSPEEHCIQRSQSIINKFLDFLTLEQQNNFKDISLSDYYATDCSFSAFQNMEPERTNQRITLRLKNKSDADVTEEICKVFRSTGFERFLADYTDTCAIFREVIGSSKNPLFIIGFSADSKKK